MKRLLVLFVMGILLNSCDDGDIQVESFDFSTVNSATCGSGTSSFFIYKVSGNEALIVQVPESKFVNKETPEGTPIIVAIDGAAVKVIYRLYDGPVSSSTLCSSPPASTPSVIEEWNATGGTVEITTNAVNTENTTTGSTLVTDFSHNITFKNITFNIGGDQEQTNDIIVFGAYKTPNLNKPIDFTTIENIQSCTDNNLLFKLSGNQAITLNLDDDVMSVLFKNESTPTDEPREFYIGADTQLNFRVFQVVTNAANFCAGLLPDATELWVAQNGVANISGLIEVETTTNGDSFIHTVRFKNVIFRNSDGLQFNFGSDYLFGKYITD